MPGPPKLPGGPPGATERPAAPNVYEELGKFKTGLPETRLTPEPPDPRLDSSPATMGDLRGVKREVAELRVRFDQSTKEMAERERSRSEADDRKYLALDRTMKERASKELEQYDATSAHLRQVEHDIKGIRQSQVLMTETVKTMAVAPSAAAPHGLTKTQKLVGLCVGALFLVGQPLMRLVEWVIFRK